MNHRQHEHRDLVLTSDAPNSRLKIRPPPLVLAGGLTLCGPGPVRRARQCASVRLVDNSALSWWHKPPGVEFAPNPRTAPHNSPALSSHNRSWESRCLRCFTVPDRSGDRTLLLAPARGPVSPLPSIPCTRGYRECLLLDSQKLRAGPRRYRVLAWAAAIAVGARPTRPYEIARPTRSVWSRRAGAGYDSAWTCN